MLVGGSPLLLLSHGVLLELDIRETLVACGQLAALQAVETSAEFADSVELAGLAGHCKTCWHCCLLVLPLCKRGICMQHMQG